MNTTTNTNPAGNPKIGAMSGIVVATPNNNAENDQHKKPEPDLMGDLAKAKRRAEGS
jgi:hypothetical protein